MNLPDLLRFSGMRRNKHADRKSDHEPDQPHWQPRLERLAGV
jgi:hypothetical protein